MGAKVIILAESLIPNFLRACAIVHCSVCILPEWVNDSVTGVGDFYPKIN